MSANGDRPTFADKLIRLFWRRPADGLPERTRRKVVVHLIPYLFFLYILAYLDRTNVAVARFGMGLSELNGGLSFTLEIIGFGTGIFFWGYWILEVPSTLSVLKWGARWVFVRILILWGISCTLIGFIGTPASESMFGWLQAPFFDTIFSWLPGYPPAMTAEQVEQFKVLAPYLFPGQDGVIVEAFRSYQPPESDLALREFYFLRFMLGFFEGGFFPSVIVYLTLWFRAQDRAKAIAVFMAAIPFSSALGTPLSGLILKMNLFGLQGWRWIYILQGVVPIFAGFATIFFLPNRPENAKWLKPDERDWLLGELHREHAAKKGHGHWDWLGQAGIVLLLTGYYFCMNVTSYGLSTFMPTIIQYQTGLSPAWASTITALAYIMGLIGMLYNGAHSDRSRERIFHVVVPLTCLAGSIFLAALFDGRGLLPVFVMLFMVGTFMYAHLPAFWPIPSIFLGSAAAASAIGFINMIGNLGGSVGPTLFGKLAREGDFASGLFFLAPFPLGSVAIILFVGYLRRDKLRAARTPPPPPV